MRIYFVVIILILSMCNVGFTQTYTLRECLQVALKRSYAIETQNIDNLISIHKYKGEKGKYLPQVIGQVTYFNYPGDLPLYIFPEAEGSVISEGVSNGVYPIPLGLRHNYSVGLNFEQTLFDADYLLKSKSIELLHSTNYLLSQKTEEETIYLVTKTYLEILKTQKKQDLISFNQKRIEKSEAIVRKQIENDMAPPSDLEEIMIKKKQLEIQHQKLRGGLDKQLNYLKFLVGYPITKNLELSMDSTDFILSLPDSLNVASNTSSKLIENNLHANELKRRTIANEKLPELKAFANLQFQAQGENMNPFSDQQFWYSPSTIGLSIGVPIVNGFERNERIESLKLEEEKIKLVEEQNNQYLQMMYQNSISDLEISKSALEEKQLNLNVQKTLFAKKNDMLANHLISINDLFEQESDLVNAEIEEAEAYFDYLIAQVEVLKTTGSLKNLLN